MIRGDCFKHYIILILCLLFISGCKQTGKALPSVAGFINDSVYLPVTVSDRPKARIKEVESLSAGEIVMFVKRYNFVAYFYDIGTERYIDSLPLIDYANNYIDSYPLGIDSLMLALTDDAIVSVSKSCVGKWDISAVTRKISPLAYIGYLSAESLHVFGDTVACITTTSEGYKEGGPNTSFLMSNNDIVFRLASDTVIPLAQHNPNPSYFLKQDYYSLADRVFVNSRKIVYSFEHSDTLELFDFKTQKDKRVKLKTKYFFKNSPFDYAKNYDFKYIEAYVMKQSRMSHLFYDKARHRIYSIMKHKGKYIEASGKKNEWDDLAQSMFVLDEQLNQLKEIYIPPGIFSATYLSFITHKGLYIPAARSKQKYHDKTLFYRIVIP